MRSHRSTDMKCVGKRSATPLLPRHESGVALRLPPHSISVRWRPLIDRHKPHGSGAAPGEASIIIEPETTIQQGTRPEKAKVMIKKIMLLLFAASTLIAAAGCHTAHGAGED